MRAIADACSSGELPAKVKVVVAPHVDAPAAELAHELGLEVAVVSPTEPNYGTDLVKALKDCNWICLAGYARLLPLEVLDSFPHRVINIHPALLPKYGGKGMYGRHVHHAVLEAGEGETGCTVHLVTEAYDEGPRVLQMTCPVEPDDTPETLAARVLRLEHEAYPRALRELISRDST